MDFNGLGDAIRALSDAEPHVLWFLLAVLGVISLMGVAPWLAAKYAKRSHRSQNGVHDALKRIEDDMKEHAADTKAIVEDMGEIKERVSNIEGRLDERDRHDG